MIPLVQCNIISSGITFLTHPVYERLIGTLRVISNGAITSDLE